METLIGIYEECLEMITHFLTVFFSAECVIYCFASAFALLFIIKIMFDTEREFRGDVQKFLGTLFVVLICISFISGGGWAIRSFLF